LKIKYKSVISFVLLLTTLPLSAKNSNDMLKTYSIGVQNFEDFQPYSTYQDNHYGGFNRDLLDMFASKHGIKFDYKVRPLKRLYSEFLAERLDFKYPDSDKWSPEQKKNQKIYYSQAVVEYIDGLIVTKQNQGKPFEELEKISIINGFTPESRYQLAKQQRKIEFIGGANYQRLLDLVAEGRVDGAYFDIIIAENHIGRGKGKQRHLVFDSNLPYIKGTRRLSSIKYPEIIALFDKFLINNKSQIDALKSQYNIIENRY
jgi:hypothetical protein